MTGRKLSARAENLKGKKFGRWTVLEFYGYVKNYSKWTCECECGTIKSVYSTHLKSGASTSCGCYQKEIVKETNKYRTIVSKKCTATKHPSYGSWRSMISRCNNPNNWDYYNYGGRGIIVCDRWLNFDNFVEDMGPKPEGFSIDRINPNGNYEKSNCRWASPIDQTNNRRHWSEKLLLSK